MGGCSASMGWRSLGCETMIVAISLKIINILRLRLSTISSAMTVAEMITIIRDLTSSGGAIRRLSESVLLSRLEGTGRSLLLLGLLSWLIMVILCRILLVPEGTLTSHTRVVGAADRWGDIVARTESAVEEAGGTTAKEAGRARVGIHDHRRTAELRSIKFIGTITVFPATKEECNEETDNGNSCETTSDTSNNGARVKRPRRCPCGARTFSDAGVCVS